MPNYAINGVVTNPDEISALFDASMEEEETPGTEDITMGTEEGQEDQDKEKKEKVAEESHPATAEELFEEEEEASERVGTEEDSPEGEEGEPSKKKGGSSPKQQLYSSIASSLAEDGALSNLSEDELKEVKDVESLVAAMKKQVDSMLDDTQKRINDALNAEMEAPRIQQYESAIRYLDTVTEDQIDDESAEGEKLRKGIIYQYQRSLGLDEDRANKMVDRAFKGGTDVEDAKEYLELLKTYYKDEYQKEIDAGKQAIADRKKKQEEDVKKFKNSMLKDAHVLGDIEVDAKTRQQAFDNWMKPTFRSEDGNYQSAIQKYIAENPMDFQMKVALLFTMTDGFTKMGKVLNQTVKKEKKKAMQELEQVVNNTQRTPSGTLNLFGHDDNATFNGMQIAPESAWR